jgi:hypothetical protein
MASTTAAAASDAPGPPPTRTLPSLFSSDFDFFTTGLRRLQETEKLSVEIHPREGLVELKMPEDLARRLKKLPREVRPEDGVLLLTANPDRMQRALAEARREENAWPRHQLLWANNPVMAWLGDRLRAAFGRHTAPVLVVPRLGRAGHAAIIVSGLLPNRRGQPLVHRWYVARFTDYHLAGVDSFDAFLESSRLGRTPLPNAGEPVDEQGLTDLLPTAVDAVKDRVVGDRDQFRAEIGPRLESELERLARLQDAQMDFIELLYQDRGDARSTHQRQQRERQVRNLFTDYKRWIQDAMTTADEPFLQVVAVLVGGAR